MVKMVDRIAQTIREVTPGGEFIPWDDAVNTARCVIAQMLNVPDEVWAYISSGMDRGAEPSEHYERLLKAFLGELTPNAPRPNFKIIQADPPMFETIMVEQPIPNDLR